MEFIGCGGARVVFRDGNTVKKYPYSPSGVTENRTEAERETHSHLATCHLNEDGTLVMEYLEEQSYDYACWQSGVSCRRFDLPDRRIQSREVNCDCQCVGCKDNVVKDYSDYADLPALIDDNSKVQCGLDEHGMLKVYDYGSDDEELHTRSRFVFYPECAELFVQWISDGNKPEDFSGWADSHPDQLPKRGTQKDYRFANKRTRELVCSGEIHWDKKET